MWRDTVFVPPFGQVVIWQRFGNRQATAWTGKSVFHCHFSDHADQGMMSAFVIDGTAHPPPAPGISYSYGYAYDDADD